MFRLKKVAGLLLLLSCPFLLTGCPDKKQAPKPSPPPPRVGVSLAGLAKDQDQAIKQTMDKQKDKEKADLDFADAQGDPLKQEQDVEKMIGEKVSAVVLEAVDPVAARDLVERLARSKIKVVALNVLPADTPVDSYVSFDRSAARTLLTRAAAASGAVSKGASLVLTVAGLDQPDLWTVQASAAGLVAEVRQYARADVQAAISGKAPVLKTGDRPAVVLAGDAALAVAAVRDLAAAGAPPAFAAGIGSSKDAFRYVSEGKLSGEVDTRPEEEGLQALQTALSLAKGQPVARHELVSNGSYSVPAQIVPVRLITRQNFYLLDKVWSGQGSGQGGSQGQGGSGGQPGGDPPGGGAGQSGGSQGKTNTLRITTEEGKTIEVHYQGKLKKIESSEAGGSQAGGKSAGGTGS